MIIVIDVSTHDRLIPQLRPHPLRVYATFQFDDHYRGTDHRMPRAWARDLLELGM